MQTKVFRRIVQKLVKTAFVAVTVMLITGATPQSASVETSVNDVLASVEMIFVEGSGNINSFHIGKYEVTQGQWRAVMGNNPAANQAGDNYPVEQVSWPEAREFINRLNVLTDKNYRLLSVAEWQYAARGGNQSSGYEYSGGNDIGVVGWFHGNSGNSSHPVGGKQPNELGIYDMTGNVWEWCEDGSSGSLRSIRGGAFDTPAMGCIPTEVSFNTMGERNPTIGFRLAHP